ncbi:flotillin-1 isoform X2 [Procambarus clarkii]|uniref:flotillin-1 isoform X2 n=1 Tax=Procambarus clarkii TaxID=6728 RepID=UPI0037422BAE
MLPVFLTCGPNEVLVVSGVGYSKPAMVTGGCLVALPCIHTWKRLSLNVMTIKVDTPGVYTAQGVSLNVTGVAQVKISTQHPDMLALACEHFLEKDQQEIAALITATLEGHQRGIMGTMTVEGYLEALGMAETSRVKRDARIGQASAARDAKIEKCLAGEELLAAQYINLALLAKAERRFEIQKAAFDQEVKAKKAEADLAHDLQTCKIKQRIKQETMETKVVERRAWILLAEQETLRQHKHLQVKIRQPAEAEKYRMERMAAAQRTRTMIEAEAQAEAKLLTADAQAAAIKAKAQAEARNMYYKAEAWKEFDNAAILSMYLHTLPKMVHGVSRSLCNTSRVKMVSSGDSPVGANKLTQEVINITNSVPELIKNVTGIDLLKITCAKGP